MSVRSLVRDFRKGDKVFFNHSVGTVLRVARDGSWVDVDWGAWHKRQPQPSKMRRLPRPPISSGEQEP